jgi:phosphatidylserine/phosphatidylglycerophosphate/cardiolipin synthase-like enzyme
VLALLAGVLALLMGLLAAGAAAPALAAAGGRHETAARRAGRQNVHRPRSSSALRTLQVEPEDGLARVYGSIAAAKKSIDLEMYELVDPRAESLLAQAAARGVDVRVILDHHLEAARNAAAYAYLSSHHVKVVWAPPGFDADHEKAMVVDTAEAWIMTLNFTSAYYANTRDFAVLDTSPADVSAIVATFDADFAHRAIVPSDGADLVWSPTNASDALLSMIAAARRSLWVESEELSDPADVHALLEAARRGVAVHVIMNHTSRYAWAFDALVAAGARVGTYPGDPGLYIHAKVIVEDPGTQNASAFLGSENFSSASLFYNRELGLVTSNRSIVEGLATVLERDFSGSTPWGAAPTTGRHAAASCSARAAAADDGYPGDYYVSVHSDEPHAKATVSDARDTWSGETDGSGYVRILLYHTAPGMAISVVVGAAHCSTSA